jgi:hypothetical protein
VAARADLPPAVAALRDAGLALLRRAPSARVAIVRSGEILEPEALHPEARERVLAEVEAAREAVCVPLSARDVEGTLRGAWGRPPGRVLDAFDASPVALRPAAQVHRGTLDGRDVAVKVRRPGIERSVRNDVALLDVLATPLRAAFPRLDAGAILRDAREQALDELDHEHEASVQRRLSRALRGVPGVSVPRPVSELSSAEVLVADWAPGETLAAGARAEDPAATARALVAAFRVCVLEAGLAPVDLRASHVVVDGADVALLGLGIARPVDRARAQLAVDAFAAVADDDAVAFADAMEKLELLPADRASEGLAVARRILGPVLSGPALLDAGALREVFGRTAREAGALVSLAAAGSPRPEDLALARSLGQLVAVLARLGVTEDWAALVTGRA